jgi:hypothetical protein
MKQKLDRIKEFAAPDRYQNHRMSPKNSSAERRVATPPKKTKTVEIVVRRGALRRFDALKTKTGELPVVVTWDRRTDDRRNAAAALRRERRQTDRRRTPPFTWDLADFVVVEPAATAKKTVKKKATKRTRKKTTKR